MKSPVPIALVIAALLVSPHQILGQARQAAPPLDLELLARPLSSMPQELHPLPRGGWASDDHTDTLVIRVSVDSAALYRSGGRCQVLVQVAVEVGRYPSPTSGPLVESRRPVLGKVWFPSVQTFWVSCPPRATQEGGARIIFDVGFVRPTVLLDRFQEVESGLGIQSMRVDATLLSGDERKPIGGVKVSRRVWMSFGD